MVVSAGFFLPPPDVLVVVVVVVGIGEVGDGMETDVCASASAFAPVLVSPLESEPQPALKVSKPATESAIPARVSEVTPMSA